VAHHSPGCGCSPKQAARQSSLNQPAQWHRDAAEAGRQHCTGEADREAGWNLE